MSERSVYFELPNNLLKEPLSYVQHYGEICCFKSDAYIVCHISRAITVRISNLSWLVIESYDVFYDCDLCKSGAIGSKGLPSCGMLLTYHILCFFQCQVVDQFTKLFFYLV